MGDSVISVDIHTHSQIDRRSRMTVGRTEVIQRTHDCGDCFGDQIVVVFHVVI